MATVATSAFDVRDFLPYLLNQAAEHMGENFQSQYKQQYGMLRTEWRVLFHLGKYGQLTATEICEYAKMHKTKISRAVVALQAKRFLVRKENPNDRRQEQLSLTKSGEKVYRNLVASAEQYENKITDKFSREEIAALKSMLKRLSSSSVEANYYL